MRNGVTVADAVRTGVGSAKGWRPWQRRYRPVPLRATADSGERCRTGNALW